MKICDILFVSSPPFHCDADDDFIFQHFFILRDSIYPTENKTDVVKIGAINLWSFWYFYLSQKKTSFFPIHQNLNYFIYLLDVILFSFWTSLKIKSSIFSWFNILGIPLFEKFLGLQFSFSEGAFKMLCVLKGWIQSFYTIPQLPSLYKRIFLPCME